MEFENLEIEVTRKAIRHLILHVKKDGRVTLSAPIFATRESMSRFVCERREWIDKARLRVLKRQELRAMPQWSADLLPDKYDELSRIIDPLVFHWAGIMGVQFSNYQIKPLKSKWGSCHILTHKLTFNLYLLMWPPECIEYVVVHELAHLLVPNHSPAFHAVLDRYYPQWKRCRKIMRGVE